MRRLDDPIPCPMGYSADLYCKYEAKHHPFDAFPHGYFGHSRGDVLGQARKHGWIIHRDNTATCPQCAKALKQEKSP